MNENELKRLNADLAALEAKIKGFINKNNLSFDTTSRESKRRLDIYLEMMRERGELMEEKYRLERDRLENST